MSERSQDQIIKELFSGFSKLTRNERFDRLMKMGVITPDDVKVLKSQTKPEVALSEKFIENVIGYYQMPLGVAANFVINKKSYAIPMAVEETSIIAAASKTAKWIRDNGEITTGSIGDVIIGQIQIAKVSDFETFKSKILENKQGLIDRANSEPAANLVKRGGGVRDIEVRKIRRPDEYEMAVVHVYMDPCEAMGANLVNQVVEFLKPFIELCTGETVTMCILSNLVDSKITIAKVTVRGVESALVDKIVEASIFAEEDPYRAATNNKGVLNGIDPILIATGNDWRAVEAGVHSYAARDGQYRSVTKWRQVNGDLVGIFEAPIMVGVVGGVTKLHPLSQLSLRMLGVETSSELAGICAAAGLVQNLGAIKALTTVGIIEGHMRLHIQNLSIGAGASELEMPLMQKKLEEILSLKSRITLSNAKEILSDLRRQAKQKLSSTLKQKKEEGVEQNGV